jgi:hypothetical protein
VYVLLLLSSRLQNHRSLQKFTDLIINNIFYERLPDKSIKEATFWPGVALPAGDLWIMPLLKVIFNPLLQ